MTQDMSSEAGREWWFNGCVELQSRGIDSIWNDDNEFALADGTFLAKWELPTTFTNPGPAGLKPVGLVGKTVFGELMGFTSQQALLHFQPERRPFVSVLHSSVCISRCSPSSAPLQIMTRSLNVGGLAYVNCSWSGDNKSSWSDFRGNTIMGINAGISFLHTYGDDIGGFGGPLPSPELFLRWIQSCIYRSRFCIHSFKPTPEDPTGNALVNEPWMYPEILPDVRAAIERRYEVLPFLYALAWESCTAGRCTSPLLTSHCATRSTDGASFPSRVQRPCAGSAGTSSNATLAATPPKCSRVSFRRSPSRTEDRSLIRRLLHSARTRPGLLDRLRQAARRWLLLPWRD
jgi:alpha-glucosidase (family GH31 glycosyl hydrolase)